jgi:hypothetical protein
MPVASSKEVLLPSETGMAVLAHNETDAGVMRRRKQTAARRIGIRCGTSLRVKKRELVVLFEMRAEAADELKRLEKTVLHQQILHGLF